MTHFRLDSPWRDWYWMARPTTKPSTRFFYRNLLLIIQILLNIGQKIRKRAFLAETGDERRNFFFKSTVRPRPFRWCAETYAFRCGQPQQNRKTEKHIFAPIFAKIARRAKKILRAQNMARGTSFEPRMEKKSLLKKLTYGGWKFKKSVFETPYLYDGSLWRPISARNNGDGPILFD